MEYVDVAVVAAAAPVRRPAVASRQLARRLQVTVLTLADLHEEAAVLALHAHGLWAMVTAGSTGEALTKNSFS